MLFNAVEEREGFVEGGGGDEGEAEGFEVEEAFEVVTIVLAHLEDGGALAFEINGS